MRSYWAFTKKEFVENVRTYKIFIMAFVFLLLGIMNPLVAKFTPEILGNMESNSMQIIITDITAMDSWTQYYKNIPLMGLIVLVILYSGMLSNEISKGTLINILTKGMKRTTVIASKMTTAVVIWTVSYFLTFLTSYGYTVYYWPDDKIKNVFVAALFVWVFGVMLLGFILLGSVIIKGTSGGLMFTGVMLAAMFVCNYFPKLSDVNPMYLITQNINLLSGAIKVSDFYKSCGVCVALTVCSLVGSCVIFNKKAI